MSRASPLGGEVYPHLVGVLTEKVSLNVGLYEIFFASWLMPHIFPGWGFLVTGA